MYFFKFEIYVLIFENSEGKFSNVDRISHCLE